MTINLRIGLAALGLLTISLAPTANAEDLLTVYMQAKESDPQISAAEAGYLATLEKRPQALAALRPSVKLSGSSSYTLSQSWTNYTDTGAGLANSTYSLSLTKPLYRRQINEQIAQTDIVIAQAKESLLAQQQNLISRVAEAYFSYLNARDSAKFSRSEAVAIERQYNQVKAYFEAGRSAITDVKESQARYDEARANVALSDQNVEIALESLQTLTGRYYKILRGASDTTPLVVPAPKDIKAWTDAALQNNKSIKVAQYAVEIAQKSVDIARAGKKPTLDFFANHDGSISRGKNTSDSESVSASLGIQFSMSLYDAGNADAAIREARYNFHKALQELESSKRTATQSVRTYYLNIITGLSQLQALKRSLESNEVADKATQEGFRVGTRTAVDVLNSLRGTYSAQRNYSSARYTFLLNTIRLKQAAGTLSEQDLASLSRILNRSSSTTFAPLKPAE